MSCSTLVNYLLCDNLKEYESKLQKVCENKRITLKYTTSRPPHVNSIIKRIFAVIKEGALAILLNAKLNDNAQKVFWTEALYTYKRVQNIMETTQSTNSPF